MLRRIGDRPELVIPVHTPLERQRAVCDSHLDAITIEFWFGPVKL